MGAGPIFLSLLEYMRRRVDIGGKIAVGDGGVVLATVGVVVVVVVVVVVFVVVCCH